MSYGHPVTVCPVHGAHAHITEGSAREFRERTGCPHPAPTPRRPVTPKSRRTR